MCGSSSIAKNCHTASCTIRDSSGWGVSAAQWLGQKELRGISNDGRSLAKAGGERSRGYGIAGETALLAAGNVLESNGQDSEIRFGIGQAGLSKHQTICFCGGKAETLRRTRQTMKTNQ
jgi:hypothetical protein